MLNFFQIKYGGLAVKGLLASFVLVLIGGGFTVYDQLDGPDVIDPMKRDVPLKCIKPECDYAEVVSGKD